MPVFFCIDMSFSNSLFVTRSTRLVINVIWANQHVPKLASSTSMDTSSSSDDSSLGPPYSISPAEASGPLQLLYLSPLFQVSKW
jgi:hypothetical protein